MDSELLFMIISITSDLIILILVIFILKKITKAIKRSSDRHYELERYKAETERMKAEAEARRASNESEKREL